MTSSCCAFADSFFYLVKNIILNNIYENNNNKEKHIEIKTWSCLFLFFLFYSQVMNQFSSVI